ncbi:MAG: hypothetical protein E6J82_05180 [Deltaproteobacteria bacterium]|nr:MAG: hypothetical protein E6J82_05180 [Deltaproteobacteria bacterium]
MAAYVALLFGMLVIGAPAQQRGIVSGLWITEALAIALPAAFVSSRRRSRQSISPSSRFSPGLPTTYCPAAWWRTSTPSSACSTPCSG